MSKSSVVAIAVLAVTTIGIAKASEIETQTITVEKLDIGRTRQGKNQFYAVVRNKANGPITVVLDLRATPGLWFKPNMQSQFPYLIWPGDASRLEAEYEFTHLSSASTLRVRLFFPKVTENGVTNLGAPFLERVYEVGRSTPDADLEDKRFKHFESKHHDIFYLPDSPAAAHIDGVARERDAAVARISSLLGVKVEKRISVVLFPDEASKFSQTAHHGAGLAFGEQIVEVYNETTKLDPYHETAHVLAEQVGNPAAVLNEGFAAYVAEAAGADALAELGSRGQTCDGAVIAHVAQGDYIDLVALFGMEEIGSARSRPTISYAEACSVVGYLIRNYGIERFRQAYAKVGPGNVAAFEGVYGTSIKDFENAWKRSLALEKEGSARR